MRTRGRLQVRLLARTNVIVVTAAVIVAVFLFLAAFGELLAPHGANDQHLRNALRPPVWAGGNMEYPLGTDNFGRDILSRIMVGTRPTVLIMLATTLVGGGLGGMLGVIAGFSGSGSRVDSLIMRTVDVSFAFPAILLALLLAIVLGPGFTTIIVAISFIIWSRFARVIRNEVLSLREREWVLQARVDGCSLARILSRHVIPHVASTWIVLLTIQLAQVVVIEAALSFLGAGVPPPTPTWGGMASQGRDQLTTAWWLSLTATVPIILIVLSTSVLGDWLRDRLDPSLRV